MEAVLPNHQRNRGMGSVERGCCGEGLWGSSSGKGFVYTEKLCSSEGASAPGKEAPATGAGQLEALGLSSGWKVS